MRMVLCASCAKEFSSAHVMERAGDCSKRDKCNACGKVKWLGRYDIRRRPA